jgi:hypothetical protein
MRAHRRGSCRNAASPLPLLLSFTLGLGLVPLGCSDDTVRPPGDLGARDYGSGPNVDACNRLKKGDYAFITPGPDATSAVAVDIQKANKVSLTVNQKGWVKFTATEAGDWYFYLNMANLAFEVQDDQYSTIWDKKDETSIAECTQVKAKNTVALPAKGTYEIRLGPNASVTVDLDIEPPTSSSSGAQ